MKCRLLVVLLSFLPCISSAQDFCGLKNSAYKEGEALRFKIYYNAGALWAGAGEVVFRVAKETYDGKPVYHITGDGSTYKSYDWFYKVRDRYESFVDIETLLPHKFARAVQEGGTRFTNSVTFDRKKKQATSDGTAYAIPGCVQDVLSAIYYARSIDYNAYQPGAKIPFSMFLDRQVYNLYIRYLGKERITTRTGTYNTIRISPLLIEGTIFKGGDKMMIWVTDDDNHIPVRIDSPITVGSIKVDLVGYTGLRNAFGGKVK